MHFNYDFSLIFYLAGCIFFLYLFISKRKAKPKPKKFLKLDPKEIFVQLKNPKTKMYVKVDKAKGLIVAHKKTRGSYKGIKIVS